MELAGRIRQNLCLDLILLLVLFQSRCGFLLGDYVLQWDEGYEMVQKKTWKAGQTKSLTTPRGGLQKMTRSERCRRESLTKP